MDRPASKTFADHAHDYAFERRGLALGIERTVNEDVALGVAHRVKVGLKLSREPTLYVLP